MQAFIPIVITIICWAVFFISFSYDRSRYRNCPLLFIALLSLAPTAFALAGERRFLLATIAISIVALAFLSVPFILVANGVIMYKREGHALGNLLSDRIDKAIDVYKKDPSPTILIPSGGQGPDEKVSEAEAMSVYMKEHGIPESDILPEDKSATTYENLKFSKALIDSRGGRKYTALVTSNYHVYRALRYCRQMGFKCTGIGSHVALYYWPSAVIREYLAIHAERKHFLYFVAGWLLCIFPVVAIAMYGR